LASASGVLANATNASPKTAKAASAMNSGVRSLVRAAIPAAAPASRPVDPWSRATSVELNPSSTSRCDRWSVLPVMSKGEPPATQRESWRLAVSVKGTAKMTTAAKKLPGGSKPALIVRAMPPSVSPRNSEPASPR
jgi:hypothetical protein